MGSGFSKTQSDIGTGFADVGAGLSGYARGFFFLIAIIMTIVAFVPIDFSPGSSNTPCGTNICLLPGDVYQDGKCLPSGSAPITEGCMNPAETCQNGKCQKGNTSQKKTHPEFLIGTAIFILLGIVVVPFSKKIQQLSHSSPGAAQAIALGSEANLLGSLFGRK